MKSRKNPVRTEKIIHVNKDTHIPDNSSGKIYLKYFFYFLVCVLPLLTAYYYYHTALTTNQFLSFPLDDPWIHLTFAKNIVEYFSFSYYKNEIVTAGSTSPLYVFIAALGFLITKNEMILSYFLGTAFFALSSFYFYKLSLKEFNNDFILSLLVCLIFIFDYNMNFIAVSGMETTLFILFLILGVYLYKEKKTVELGIVLGLIIWIRPDGAAFIAAFIVDYFYNRWFVKDNDKRTLFSYKELFTVSGIFLIFLLAYFAMNLYLSGTILSNTYSAKVAFNTDSETRIIFLTHHIWNFFTKDFYSFLLPGFIIVIVKFIYDISKRRFNQNSIYILFIFLFILLYLIKLPMSSRFGRYFMPMVPFYILGSMCGYYLMLNLLKDYINKPLIIKILNFAVISSIVISSVFSYFNYSDYYAFHCAYIHDRHVRTANWFRDNTNENDIIGTHDIGAIGFYSGRKIIDIAGLINPDLMKHSNQDNYNEVVTDYFKEHGVTYTTFYREWFLMLNQNPEFISPGDTATEAFYVYKFYPGKSRVLPRKINYMLTKASNFIVQGNGEKIISSIDEILKLEPDFALAYYYRAYGYQLLQDYKNFERDIQKSLVLYPEFKDALIDYARYLINSERYEEAKSKLNTVIKIDPKNRVAYEYLNLISDKLKAPGLSQKVNDLMIASSKYVDEKNADKIVSAMSEIIKLDPEYSLAYYYRAFGYTLIKDYKNFEKDIQKSIMLDPDFKDALIEYGKFLMSFKRYEEAKSKFNEVIKFDPKDSVVLEYLNSVNDTLKNMKK